MISINDYNKLSIDEIYNNISNEMDNLYNNFSFLKMPKDLFCTLIKKFIENFEILNKDIKDNVEPFLIADISKKFRIYIGIQVNEYGKKEYLFNYLGNLKIESKKENINEFKKFCKYINDCKIELSNDLINELFKNEILYKMLETILEKHKYELQTGIYEYKNQAENLIISCFIDNLEVDFYEENVKNDDSYEDSVGIYLKECGHNILSREEERELAVKCKIGTEQERKKARKKFAEYNLRLVISEAKKYKNRGLEYGDLLGYGNIGLMVAIDKFDVERGFKFSTFAPWWIRQSIVRAIGDTSRSIRVPIHTLEKINKCNKAIMKLRNTNGVEPSVEDVAEELEWSIAETRDTMTSIIDTVSMNSLVGEEGDNELGDFIADTNAIDPEVNALKKAQRERLGKILEYSYLAGLYHNDKALPKSLFMQSRDVTILVLRKGFLLPEEYRYILTKEVYDNGKMKYTLGKEYTLEAVGTIFNITRERTRQIEAKSMRKLIRLVELDNDQKLFKVSNKNIISKKSVYDILDQYKKEEIDFAVLELSLKHQNLLIQRNDSNSHWTEEDEKKFVELVIPEIEEKINSSKNELDMFSNVKMQDTLLTDELISEIIFNDLNTCDIKVKSAINIISQSNIFSKLLSDLPDFEKEIISLRFSKIENTFRTIKQIALSLHVQEGEVSYRIRLFMNEYRQSLNNILGMLKK